MKRLPPTEAQRVRARIDLLEGCLQSAVRDDCSEEVKSLEHRINHLRRFFSLHT